MNILVNTESITNEVFYNYRLPILIELHGVTVELKRKETVTEVEEVFGNYSGNQADADLESFGNINVLLESGGFVFNHSGVQHSVEYELAYIYTLDELLTGDIFILTMTNGLEKHYEVMAEEDIGITNSVVKRFRVTGIGG